jgi:hypothetical protein
VPIADRARLIILGDWGTGLPRARKVADQIRNVLEQGREERLEQHIVHLGDVYYSGWKREYENRFLAHWPVDEGEADAVTSWSLNANHDMYSGGHAYFETLLKDRRFLRHQSSSFFSLTNTSWKVLGLDTGWDDGGLQEPQPAWVRQQAEEAHEAGQKVMLLSHHQPFSVFEKDNSRLQGLLRDVLGRPLVHSWIWGHEHRCVVYGPAENLHYSCCLGNGGVPVYMLHKEGAPLPPPAAYEYRARIRSGLESWALFGFAVLDFDGGQINIRYLDEDGSEHHSQVVS